MFSCPFPSEEESTSRSASSFALAAMETRVGLKAPRKALPLDTFPPFPGWIPASCSSFLAPKSLSLLLHCFLLIFLFSLPLGLWRKSNHVIQLPKQLSGRRIRLSMQETHETCIQPLGQEDPLEEAMATHCSHLAWRIPWTDGLQSMGATVHGVEKSQVWLSN